MLQNLNQRSPWRPPLVLQRHRHPSAAPRPLPPHSTSSRPPAAPPPCRRRAHAPTRAGRLPPYPCLCPYLYPPACATTGQPPPRASSSAPARSSHLPGSAPWALPFLHPCLYPYFYPYSYPCRRCRPPVPAPLPFPLFLLFPLYPQPCRARRCPCPCPPCCGLLPSLPHLYLYPCLSR